MVINIGGAVVTLTLDGKGHDKSSQGIVALRLKPSKRNPATKKLEFQGGDVAFAAKIMNGAWAAIWKMDPKVTSTNVPMISVSRLAE